MIANQKKKKKQFRRENELRKDKSRKNIGT